MGMQTKATVSCGFNLDHGDNLGTKRKTSKVKALPGHLSDLVPEDLECRIIKEPDSEERPTVIEITYASQSASSVER